MKYTKLAIEEQTEHSFPVAIRQYVNSDIEKKLQSIEKWVEDGERGIMTLLGVEFTFFNARTGRGGEGIEEGMELGKGGRRRNSRDEKVDREGRKLVYF